MTLCPTRAVKKNGLGDKPNSLSNYPICLRQTNMLLCNNVRQKPEHYFEL